MGEPQNRTGRDQARPRRDSVGRSAQLDEASPQAAPSSVRNLVAAAWAFARRGVLVQSRRHLDSDVSTGIDFVVTKSILSRADVRAVNEFIGAVWVPTIRDQARLKALTSKLEALEDDALFGPVVLEEFAELGMRLSNRSPSDEVAEETAAFVDHLYDLSQREPGVTQPTHFDGRWIRCAFVLVATPTVVSTHGTSPYRNAIDGCIRNAFPRVYVVARGSRIEVAREVVKSMEGDTRILHVREYTAPIPGPHGGTMMRLATRFRIDVREYVGIGQRPIVAVGPGFEADIARQRAKQRQRVAP